MPSKCMIGGPAIVIGERTELLNVEMHRLIIVYTVALYSTRLLVFMDTIKLLSVTIFFIRL